ncbi:MAG TPA: hypothetical protein VH393_05335 [Ktedonobacterales bacterium]
MATLNENIADMTRTANRIGERDNWQGELYEAISRDLTKWKQKRDRLLRKAQRVA